MSSSPTELTIVRPTIPVRYLIEMGARSGASAPNIAAALAESGLPGGALRMRRLRISIAQFETFYDVLRRRIGDELFGYSERPVPPGSYATLVRLLTGCADLSSAFDELARFYRLFDRHAYWRLDVRDQLATLTLTPRDRDQARSVFFVHTMLLAPWRTLAWLAGRELELIQARLPQSHRRFAPETRYLFGCDQSFGAGGASITLRREVFALPVARRPREADAYARSSLRQLLLPAPRVTLEGELRTLFASSAPLADPSLSDAARRLGMSRAVLARKLKREGLLFQRVKDEVRRDHAIGLLTGTSLSIATIAEKVGYSASSAFQRAFREWTGVSPGTLRRPP